MSSTTQKTYALKAGELSHAWRVMDADGKTLGRLAGEIARYLRGKHRPIFSEHLDVGDYVVVVNAARLRVTGNKLREKVYYRHSGYPGGFKAVILGDLLAKHPDRVVKHAVKGMLPHNTLGRKMLKKLKVYGGPTHPHEAQVRAGKETRRGTTARATGKRAPSTTTSEEQAA
jgi:large subunit ribosomal protein L13